jgi:hypothetical protein
MITPGDHVGKLAAANLARRTRLFNRYSQNWNIIKRHPALRIHPDVEDVYVCPLCYCYFSREDIRDLDKLSLDHVPAEVFGGALNDAIMVCKPCNSEAGRHLDGQLHRLLSASDVANRAPGAAIVVRYSAVEGTDMAATVRIGSDRAWELIGDRKRSNPQHHIIEDAFLDSLPTESSITWRVKMRVGKPRFADVAVLRYAYLSLFRMFGYGAIVYPAMQRVREQILNPSEQILHKGWTIWNIGVPDEAVGVNIVTRPYEVRSFLVVFNLLTRQSTRVGIFLPASHNPDIDFQAWLRNQKEAELKLVSYQMDADILTHPVHAFEVFNIWALQDLPETPLYVGSYHGLKRRYPSKARVNRWKRCTTFRSP